MDRIEPVSRSDRAVSPVGLGRLTSAEREEERRRRERERRRKADPKAPRTFDGRLDIRA